MYPDEIDARLIEGMAKLQRCCHILIFNTARFQSHAAADESKEAEKGCHSGEEDSETFSYPTLRTTFIVGFPTEEEADFSELMQFVEDIHWDRMGAFPYSPEEDTPAYSMDGAVDEDVKEARLAQLMKRQEEISLENQRRMVGEIIEVLVEDQEGLTGVYRGRGASSAPDEVDGIVMFKSERFIEFGSFVKVRITEALPHDFKGVEVC